LSSITISKSVTRVYRDGSNDSQVFFTKAAR
jgi:hypothetical protein